MTRNPVVRFFVFTLFLWVVGAVQAAANFSGTTDASGEFDFTVPAGLENRVQFWKKVYTQYSTRHAIIHDEDDLDIIYKVVYLGDESLSSRARNRKLRSHIIEIKNILAKLARNQDPSTLTYEEDRIRRLVGGNFHKAARNIRVQLGQMDRFQEGLRKSGLYMKEIRKIFREVGVPVELSALPHVESSFQLHAYSSAGAAGVWQFTRSTGRLFMTVNYEIDERRDPIISAYAAARLLKHNYEELQSWPLAITAYNHGVNGMRRAKRQFGDDIIKIIGNYRSRTFGFASKNFFSEFMAALDVTQNPRQYFPGIVVHDPFEFAEITLNDYVHITTLVKHLDLTRGEIAEYNPSLRKPVVYGKRRIPKGFVLKVPIDKEDEIANLYSSIPEDQKFGKQVRVRWYTVERGDTLSSIARRLGTSIHHLKELNSLHSHRIYKGQVLEIPGQGYQGGVSIQNVQVSQPQANWGEVEIPDDLETIKYRVRRRDTLTQIARKFGVHVSVLAKMNKMDDPHSLRPGQHVDVPKPGTDFEAKLAMAATKKNTQTEAEKLEVQMKGVEPDENTVAASTSTNLNAEIASEDSKEIESSSETVNQDSVPSTEDLNKNRPAFSPVKLVADKNDYQVGLIKVDHDETLSHFADWARLSVSELRRLNNLRRRGSRISVNQALKVPFRRTTPEEFEQKRQEYHKAIQEDFFSNYKVDKVVTRKLKRGETLWEICNNIYSIPIWLLSNYNPDKDFGTLTAGEAINIPILVETESAS